MSLRAIQYGHLVQPRAWWCKSHRYLNTVEHGENTWNDAVPLNARLTLWDWWFGSYAWMTTALEKDVQSGRIKFQHQSNYDTDESSSQSIIPWYDPIIDPATLNVGHVTCGIALELAFKCAVIAANGYLPERTHGISEIYNQISPGGIKDKVRGVSWHPYDHRHSCVDGSCIIPEDRSWNVAGRDDCECEFDVRLDMLKCSCEAEWVHLQMDTHFASANRKYLEGASNNKRSSGYLRYIGDQAGNQLATDRDGHVIRYAVGGTEPITIPKAARINAEVLNVVNEHVWNRDVIPFIATEGLPRLLEPG